MCVSTRAYEVLNYLENGGYDLQDLFDVAKEFANQKPSVKDIPLNVRIAQILYELGIPKIKGQEYLVETISEAYSNNVIRGITKLYSKIAVEHETRWWAVERNIRHAIEIAFKRAPSEVINKYFQNTIFNKSGVPTNTEFIKKLADWLHMEEVE